MNNFSKQGIIWDFDDTLVNTAVFFEEARYQFADYMVSLGFPLTEILEVLNTKDIENVNRAGGFLKHCFPEAMVQTYHHFCEREGILPNASINKRIEDIGWWVFSQKPEPIKGAEEVLSQLKSENKYETVLATKGDPTIQWKRIKQSGIEKYFDKIYVLNDKNSFVYLRIAGVHSMHPETSWLLGNSIKSDINPGIKAGFNCVYIPNQYTWDYEHEEPVGNFITLESLTEVPELILAKEDTG